MLCYPFESVSKGVRKENKTIGHDNVGVHGARDVGDRVDDDRARGYQHCQRFPGRVAEK